MVVRALVLPRNLEGAFLSAIRVCADHGTGKPRQGLESAIEDVFRSLAFGFDVQRPVVRIEFRLCHEHSGSGCNDVTGDGFAIPIHGNDQRLLIDFRHTKLTNKAFVLEFERTTPSAPFKGTGTFLDGASTPPLPSLCQGGDFASTPRSATTKCVYFPTQGNICICRTPVLQTGQSGVFSDDKSDEIG